MWVWRRTERVKWTDKIKNSVLLERVGEGRIMLELIKKRKRNWLDHWLRRNCLLKNTLEGMVNGKKVRNRRRYQMIDNIMINGLFADTKRNAEKIVEWRMLSLQWKMCPWAEHYNYLYIYIYVCVCVCVCECVSGARERKDERKKTNLSPGSPKYESSVLPPWHLASCLRSGSVSSVEPVEGVRANVQLSKWIAGQCKQPCTGQLHGEDRQCCHFVCLHCSTIHFANCKAVDWLELTVTQLMSCQFRRYIRSIST